MLSFALSGVGFRFTTDSQRVMSAAQALFGGYQGGDGGFLLNYRECSPWDLPSPMSRSLVVKGGHMHLGGEFAGEVDWQTRRAQFAVGATGDLFPPGSLQNTLRVLLVHILADSGGLLMHAASVVHRGRAYVFFGESGVGKSTLARTFPLDQLLGDEIACIDGAGMVHRAPFTGETLPPSRPLSAPLAGVFALQQAPSLHITPGVSPRTLLRSVVHTGTERQLTLRLLENAARLQPAYTMQTPILSSDALFEALDSLDG